MTSLISSLRLLLLGIWLGAAIFFGAAVAPNVFGVLRSSGLANANELAGGIVTRLLAIINPAGLEIALFLFITALFLHRHRKTVERVAEMISIAIMAIMTGVSHWIISARMQELRRSMAAPIDQIAPTDVRRIEFDSLHRYSVIFMAVAMIAALVAFFISARAARAGGK